MDINTEKGFTLIELLAVLVILTIIMTISIPIVLDIVSNAQKNSFKSSVLNLLKAVENEYMSENINGIATDKNYEFENGVMTRDILIFNGGKPFKGNILVRSSGETEAVLYNNGWCAIKPINKEEVYVLKKDITECDLINISDLILAAMSETSIESNIIYVNNSFFDQVSAKGYNDMYTSLDNYATPISDCGTGDNYYNGNYQKHRCLVSGATSSRLNLQTNNNADRILSGTTTYNLATLPSNGNSWLGILMVGSCYTTSNSYSNITINFNDGYSANIKESIDNGYINPLIIYGSSSSNDSYVFPTTYDAIIGGSSGTQSYADLYIYLKPLNKIIESITITSATNSGLYSTCSDGLHVLEYPNLNITPYPNGATTLTSPIIEVGKIEETVAQGSEFVENTVTAYDQNDGEISDIVNISGYVNYNVPGEYLIKFDVTNSLGIKAETKEKIINVIERPYHGDGIDELRTDIYTTKDDFDQPLGDCGTGDDYYNGNYQKAGCLYSGAQLNKLSKETNNTRDRILAGTNTYTFENSIIYDRSWIRIELYGGCWTTSNQYSNLNLNFEDGYTGYITQAIADGYIEPAVIYASSMTSASYVFPTPKNLLSGGSTGTQGYANFYAYIKPINQKLVSITLTASASSGLNSSCSDGFAAHELINFDFSTLSKQELQIQQPYIMPVERNYEIITAGSDFISYRLKAFDNQDFDITDQVIMSGPYNKDIAGIYNINYNVTDSDGNQAVPVPKTIEVIARGTYESNYANFLPNLYHTLDSFTNPIVSCGSGTTYFNGNYQFGLCLHVGANMRKLSKETNNTRDRILAGTNTYNFDRLPLGNSTWIRLLLYGNCYTSTNSYSNIRINFTDGYSGFISEAINEGYIESFVIYGSSAANTYVFPSTINAISGGSTGSQRYANFYVFIKPKSKTLESVTLTSTISSGIYSTCSDGLDAYELINYDLSTTAK
jgi:prepilin-type N-terminal cleavage/methylation domain-containing protein